MNLIFEAGIADDIDELEQLYNDLNDHLANGKNYPGWIKGVYPVRQNAVDGIKNGTLFVARSNGKIAGSIILSHVPEPAYRQGNWNFDLDYSEVLVVYTFVVHPDFMKMGVGTALLDFAKAKAEREGIRSLRLDVFEGNMPAIRLYESWGFQYAGTVDLGLGSYGLNWFRLYEKGLGVGLGV